MQRTAKIHEDPVGYPANKVGSVQQASENKVPAPTKKV